MNLLKSVKTLFTRIQAVAKPVVPQAFVVKIDRSSIVKNPARNRLPGEMVNMLPGPLMSDGRGRVSRELTPVYSIGGFEPEYLYDRLPCTVTCAYCKARFLNTDLVDDVWYDDAEEYHGNHSICPKCDKPHCCSVTHELLSAEIIEEHKAVGLRKAEFLTKLADLFEEYDVGFDTGNEDYLSICNMIKYSKALLHVFPDSYLTAKEIREIRDQERSE